MFATGTYAQLSIPSLHPTPTGLHSDYGCGKTPRGIAGNIQDVPLATELGISLIMLPLAGGPLLRVATIRRTATTHYRHIPFDFSQRTLWSLVLELLKNCRVRQRVGHTVYAQQ